MSNIALLPQIAGSFAVARNADWRDVIQFAYPATSLNVGQPLDLTGIKFSAQVRGASGDPSVLLDMSTDNNLLLNGGTLGTFAFAVPASIMARLQVTPSAVMDIVAEGQDSVGTLQKINLCQVGGPLTVSIGAGVTFAS